MPQETQLANVKVLIADDEIFAAMILEEALVEFGGTVVGPISLPSHIVPMALKARPDIALLDVKMTDGTSYEAAIELRAAGIPVILVTGYDVLPDCPEELKDVPLVTKPWDLDVLISLIIKLAAAPVSARSSRLH